MKLRLTIGISIALLAMLTPSILTAQSLPYGTARMPKTCPSRSEPKRGAPSVAQAKMYFTCDNEWQLGEAGSGGSTSFIILTDNLTMQVAPRSRPANGTDLKFNSSSHSGNVGMDTTQPVYDIRGSYDRYLCYDTTRNSRIYPVGANCNASRYTSAGICFRNTFGDWHCMMQGTSKKIGDKLPPPQ